jgi:hypothetical protein
LIKSALHRFQTTSTENRANRLFSSRQRCELADGVMDMIV